jgi:ankyrin repeat protein
MVILINELLIDKGANIHAKDVSEKTPLHHAAQYGHLKVVKLLLDKGADINARDKDNMTPSQLAAKVGYKEVSDLLIEKMRIYM